MGNSTEQQVADRKRPELIEHVRYEFAMLNRTATWLGSDEHESAETWLRYAVLESFLLHARALIDFFYAPGRGDDVVAGGFVESWKPAAMPTILKKAKKRANKRLAHLTAIRTHADDKDWPVWKIYAALESVAKEFNRVSDQELAPGMQPRWTVGGLGQLAHTTTDVGGAPVVFAGTKLPKSGNLATGAVHDGSYDLVHQVSRPEDEDE